jgi:hypothetical protein
MDKTNFWQRCWRNIKTALWEIVTVIVLAMLLLEHVPD